MPALRALLNRRKGSPTMSTTPPAPPGVGGGGVGPPSAAALPPPGASPHAAAPPVAPSPRTAAQLARAAFFSTPSPSTKPAPPPVTRRASEEVSLSPTASSPGQPLRRQLSAASLGLGLGGLGLGGLGLSRVKSADGLADVAPLLSRQRSCDSAVGATGAAGRRSPPGRAPGRARAVSCYNVLQFLKDRALPRSSPPPAGQLGPPLRKCLTTGRLQGLAEPVRPVNRLRIPSHGGASAASASRVCSRCSSILSLASSSRYSLHASAASFTPLSPSRTSSPIPGAPPPPEEYVLCKLCLMDVPETLTTRLGTCQCRYCVEVSRPARSILRAVTPRRRARGRRVPPRAQPSPPHFP
ncbi:translation initiation factor IF-2-like [Frankliniella occidentalis]|uniref:Translation initiation factor IF-2-like n=1 Tax=Frankliniella occidentalis TaxID=133901 RepID=A0A9C6U081_FRAOC|nr:translation initiation factor IF-2-like [Frankliniella occidentalis]XP_052120523.1 translation initiation factor IF-2-like [Frankliniella occidentalis]